MLRAAPPTASTQRNGRQVSPLRRSVPTYVPTAWPMAAAATTIASASKDDESVGWPPDSSRGTRAMASRPPASRPTVATRLTTKPCT